MTLPVDPVENLATLIRCPSVTPEDSGALEVLGSMLAQIGFTVERPVFSEPGTPDIQNLYARRSGNGPHLMFAGHTDVVPVGDEAAFMRCTRTAALTGWKLEAIRDAARRAALRCDWQRVLDQLENAYRQVLGAPRAVTGHALASAGA